MSQFHEMVRRQADLWSRSESDEGSFLFNLWNDQLAALFFLVLAAPTLLIIALLIKLTSKGPIFYFQERIGLRGKPFFICKFRTMCVDSESKTGPILSSRNDDRITPFGRFLRNCHLDEVPQLWNILKGEMSFLGPRPERTVFVERFNQEIPSYERRHDVKPGVMGLAQICCDYDAHAQTKLVYDLKYIHHRYSLPMVWFIVTNTLKKLTHVQFNEKIKREKAPGTPARQRARPRLSHK